MRSKVREEVHRGEGEGEGEGEEEGWAACDISRKGTGLMLY